MIDKLYSETNLFAKVFEFHSGLNFIIGKYSGDKKTTGINGIGKSTLVRLIDYCLLSDKAEGIFNENKYSFLREEEHNVCLEFTIRDKQYIIKRFFNKKDIFFGEVGGATGEYLPAELKEILCNKFFPIEDESVIFYGNKFRTVMNFFIKDDLESQKRLDPLSFMGYEANVKDKSLYNFFLLNLPTKEVISYSKNISEYNKWNTTINGLEKKISQNSGKSLSEFKTEKISIEKKIKSLEANLSEYKFLEEYKGIENELIDLTSKINENLQIFYSLDNKLKQIKQSYKFDEDVDLERVKNIYNSVVEDFGDYVTRRIKEVINIRKVILENRSKFLAQKERELEDKIGGILEGVKILEQKRSNLYKLLDEKGAMDSISNTYKRLIEEKIYLEQNVQELRQIDEIQSKMTNIDISISENKGEIIELLKKQGENIDNLRSLFEDILKNTIAVDEEMTNAYFDIKASPKSTRGSLPFKIEISVPKADALGQSRLKIVVYDLMVFLNIIINKRKLPDFLIHDGVFHGIAIKTKINILNYLYHKNLEIQGFQYFTTFNEDEIYSRDGIFGKTEFDIENYVVAKFSDKEDETIFKRIFK